MTQDQIDVYRTEELTQRYQSNLVQLTDFLERHGIVRVSATLDANISLNDTEAIAASFGEKLCDGYSKEVIEASQRNVSRFLREELLGIDNSRNYHGLARSPLVCPISRRYLRAVEDWLIPIPKKEGFFFPIMTALYGLTDPKATGSRFLHQAEEDQDLSSAFIHQKGWHLTIGALQHLFGRNWYSDFSFEMADSHIADACRNPLFNFYSLGGSKPTIYQSYPFSTERDVITYPADPSEFGAKSHRDPKFLRASIEAKALIREHFERVCEEDIPITSSLPKELLENPPKPVAPRPNGESRIKIIRVVKG